jgi:hypothetical protein
VAKDGRRIDKDRIVLRCEAATTPLPTTAACPVNPNGGPSALTFVVGPGSDLDTGWTGWSHNQRIVQGTRVAVCLSDCDLDADPLCSGRGETDTGTRQGTVNGVSFGPPLPLSTGGVPVCVVNTYRGDIGLREVDLRTGAIDGLSVPLTWRAHGGIRIDQPCPVCRAAARIGAEGRCVDGPRDGRRCAVEGLTPFGSTSTQCPPDPRNGISDLEIDLDFTTGESALPGDGFLCKAPPVGTGGPCPCESQRHQNLCDSPCGEGECPSGLEPGVDQKCCVNNDRGRGCFEGDVVIGGNPSVPVPAWPDPNYPKVANDGALASAFCMGQTTSLLVNGVVGLAGPGTMLLPGPMTISRAVCIGGAESGEPCGADRRCGFGVRCE